MAVEAAKQICPPRRSISGFYVSEARFLAPLIVSESPHDETETMVHLKRVQLPYEKESVWSDVKVFRRVNEEWSECFQAKIQTQCLEPNNPIDNGREEHLASEKLLHDYLEATTTCTIPVNTKKFYDHHYENGVYCGETFQLLDDICWNGRKMATAKVDVSHPRYQTPNLAHPAILDAAVQLVLVQNSKGATTACPTFIPFQMTDTWISASGWQLPQTSSIRLMATAHYRPGGRSGQATIRAIADDGSLLWSVNRLILSHVSRNATETTGQDKKLLYGIEWKPQLSLLNPEQVKRICGAETPAIGSVDEQDYREEMTHYLEKTLQTVLGELTDVGIQPTTEPIARHATWMRWYEKHARDIERAANVNVKDLLLSSQEIESSHPTWEMVSTVARNLRSLLLGNVDSAALLVDTGLVQSACMGMYRLCCDARLRRYLELASHEKPNLRILEICDEPGCAVMSEVLRHLNSLEEQSGSAKFAEYACSGPEEDFLQMMKQEFRSLQDRLSSININADGKAGSQGLDRQKFDLVIFGSLINPVNNWSKTLQNIHNFLGPGGKLSILTFIQPHSLMMNFGFGVLPGWWVDQESGAPKNSVVSESHWDILLKQNGFSGNDIVIPDVENVASQICGMIITTKATGSRTSTSSEPRLALVIDKQSELQAALAGLVEAHAQTHTATRTLYLDQISSVTAIEDEVAICLFEVGSPCLHTLSETQFSRLKQVLNQWRSIVWVTTPNVGHPSYSYSSLNTGLLRVIRSEAAEKHIVTLTVEGSGQGDQDPSLVARYINQVLQSLFEEKSEEVEFIVREGVFTTGRLVEESSLNANIRSLLSPQWTEGPWSSGPPLKLSLGTTGILDTLQFEEDESSYQELGPTEVEVETKAWGLNFRDVFVALGRLESDDLGYDCAGVVTRVGSECKTDLRPGSRVCMASVGCMRTFARGPETRCVALPESLSFEAAASILTPGMTAYYSLVEVARLRRGEKVLIHSASGSTGQMACWVAKMIGAEIFATVGLPEKKDLLKEHFGIPEDHIFYSRNTSFSRGILRMTNGYGVDVVLNSLSGDSLRASWDCIAPYGRFVEIGKSDIVSNGSLPMGNFSKNTSFSAVDLHHMGQSNTALLQPILHKTVDLVVSGVIRHPTPLHNFPASQVEAAFRYLQSGKNTGRIIIKLSDNERVQVSEQV